MAYNQQANQDFERAVLRGFWRKILARLTGENNELLPFDEVRDRLPIRGQHYLGLKQVDIGSIVGSLGRYRDFDRAFLPLQSRTKDRWVSIDRAFYEEVILPPVELFKIGEIYFVKDGNHRVSVARERGQVFVDAYVTEIDIPVVLTPSVKFDDLLLKKEFGEFILHTRLDQLRPLAVFETSISGQYQRLLEHIDVHRWYLGEQRRAEVPYPEAVASWYDNVYWPLIALVRADRLLDEFRGATETDLYLWIMTYQAYLRQAYREDYGVADSARLEAARQFVEDFPQPAVRRLIGVLNRTAWIDELILSQERALFLEQTRLLEVRPEAEIRITIPGQYGRIREHIAAHRWYLGERRGSEVPYSEAVASWYDHVYCPLVEIIREQQVLGEFPGRTEADLYLWVIEHQWYLREAYGSELPIDQVTEQFTDDFSQRPVKKVVKAIKKAARKK